MYTKGIRLWKTIKVHAVMRYAVEVKTVVVQSAFSKSSGNRHTRG